MARGYYEAPYIPIRGEGLLGVSSDARPPLHFGPVETATHAPYLRMNAMALDGNVYLELHKTPEAQSNR